MYHKSVLIKVQRDANSSSSSSSSSVICQTTGPKPLPKRFLHTVRSRRPSFNWQYPLLSLRSSSSFLCLLPRLLITSIDISSSSSSSVICQTTGPKPLPKRFLHTVRSRSSSFNWQYPLLSLRSSSSFLCLLPRLVITSIDISSSSSSSSVICQTTGPEHL